MRKEKWKEQDTEFRITKTMTSGNKSIYQPIGKSQQLDDVNFFLMTIETAFLLFECGAV